jgi:uncharacterized membrane protein YedE/YeeE
MQLFIVYLIGLLFGLGIVISGMANPAKVINFFDLAGTWDPSLAFVMIGALVITFVGYRMVLRRPAPVFSNRFGLPANNQIDRPLIAGSAIFGVGWGISGFCPGGALPALGTGKPEVLLFVAAMILGIFVAKLLKRIELQLTRSAVATSSVGLK